MDQEQEQELGPAEPWQIKQFPRRLRLELTEQARQERVSVGELLTRLVVSARDAGWQFDASAEPLPAADAMARLALVERAVATAVSLASAPDVPRAFRSRANRLLRESLPGGPRQPPPVAAPGPLAIAAPEPAGPA
jgi:hypothetical protein